jgi:tetratricopeptide (TPR) repeat protein
LIKNNNNNNNTRTTTTAQLPQSNSTRLSFLRAFIYESAERYDDAMDIYKSIIRDNRHPIYVLKSKQRLITIHLEFQSDKKSILTELKNFTMMYSDNYDGWFELYKVYISLGMMEEAIMVSYQLILLENENFVNFNYSADVLLQFSTLKLQKLFGTNCELFHTMTTTGGQSRDKSRWGGGKLGGMFKGVIYGKGDGDIGNEEKNEKDENKNKNRKIASKSTPSSSPLPLEPDIHIQIIYDHLINARYYYCTSFQLCQNQIAAMGILKTSRLIISFLSRYPVLVTLQSTIETSKEYLDYIQLQSQLNNDEKKNGDKNQSSKFNSNPLLTPPKQLFYNKEQGLIDSYDLIAMASDYLSRKLASKSMEKIKAEFIEKRRLQSGDIDGNGKITGENGGINVEKESTSLFRAFDSFSAMIFFQREKLEAEGQGDCVNNISDSQVETCQNKPIRDQNKSIQNEPKVVLKNNTNKGKSKKQD